MEFSLSDASRVDSAPNEAAVNLISDTYGELREFLRKYGNISAEQGGDRIAGASTSTAFGSQNYQFLDRTNNHKYRFDHDLMIQFFELLDACRRESCILHILEHVQDEPAGLMIDLDRHQDAPSPSIFTQDYINRTITLLANVISEVLVQNDDRRDLLAIVEETRQRMLRRTAAECVASDGASSSGAMDPAAMAALSVSPAPEIPQDEQRTYHIFVIKRSQITRDTKNIGYKDGIHLLVPELWMSKAARKFVLSRFKDRIWTASINNLSRKDAEALVDMNSSSVSTHLLGSCKLDGVIYTVAAAARITRFQGANTVIPLSVDSLNKGYNVPPEEGGIKINLTYELSLTQYLDKFRGQPTWLLKSIVKLPEDRNSVVEKALIGLDIDQMVETQTRRFEDQILQLTGSDPDAAFICDLLNALPVQYAREYDKWRDVLMALCHASVTMRRDNYKLLAQHFSMRAPEKWNPGEFEKSWSIFCRRCGGDSSQGAGQPARITLRSLEFWARTENPVAYNEAKQKSARGYLISQVFANYGVLSHDTVAQILVRRLRGLYTIDTDAPDRSTSNDWYEFVMDTCSNIQPGEIYKWRRTRVPHAIYQMITTQIRALCEDILREILARAERTTDEGQKKRYLNISKAFKSSIRSLGHHGFQESAIKSAVHELDIRGFVESLDTQRYIIGVGNGVLEFIDENARAIAATGAAAPQFVPRLIRDYHELRVSNFTDVDYIPYDKTNPYIREVLQAYHDIYGEPDVFKFVLMYLSTWLDACDVQRELLLLGGGGSNGKTWSVFFPQMTLGQKYVKVLKMQLLTEEHEKAREANSALMQLKGTRGGYFDESNEGDRLNPARIKSIVTPGVQSGRDLYSREEQFRNTANCIAVSNYDFIVNATDNGTWDRLLFYQCKARFVSEPDPASPYEHMKRVELTTEWPRDMNYRRAMLSILVHYRVRLERKYGGHIMRVPHPTITAETNAFRRKQDPITRFIIERVAKSPRSNTSLRDIIDRYVAWYQEAMGRVRPKTTNLQSTFQNSRIGEYIKRMGHRGGACASSSTTTDVPGDCELIAEGLRLREKNDKLQEDETFFE